MRYKIISLFILWTFLLVTPGVLRTSGTYMGYDAYYQLRISKSTNTDTLIFSERPFQKNLTHRLINLLPEKLIATLPGFIGIITFWLLVILLRSWKINKLQTILSMTLFTFSPLFIKIFTEINEIFIPVMLSILAAIFFTEHKYIFGMVPTLLLPLFLPQTLVIIPILIMVFYLRKSRFIGGLAMIGISLAYIIVQGKEAVLEPSFYITDLGTSFGIGVFSLALAMFGLLIFWKEKKKHIELFLLLICTLILTLYDIRYLFILEFIFIYLGGYAFTYLWRMKWEINTLQKYTLLLIFCGLLFSGFSFAKELSNLPPSPEEIYSLEKLSTYEDGVVFTHYTKGYIVQSIAGKPVITDMKYYESSKEKTRIQDSDTLFYSRHLDVTEDLIDKYSIKYFWITPDMKQGLVWESDDEGLLFLLANSARFRRLYKIKGYEIWEYLG